ncbi:Serine/threonine-protein kinase CDL1 [Spatholobus suberectus]|nr:Serine/threonine-protein kinase CDL1 [Spatholobus suberectus]
MTLEEVKFWTNPTLKGYPNLVTLIGYPWERDVKGLVYDLNPLDTLDNVMKDNMNRLQRINVIHELAKLMKFIHDQEKQNMVLNISASHILLDKDYKPKLFDLLLLSECIEFFPANRPTMRDVLHRLDNLLVLQRLVDARATKREKQLISS